MKKNKTLTMTEGDYYKLMLEYKKLDLMKKELELKEKDVLVNRLAGQLSQTKAELDAINIKVFKQKMTKERESLEEVRKELAKKLHIETLDDYVLDDTTFELKHVNSLSEVLGSDNLKSESKTDEK